jgi:hypothetical protein
MLVFELKDQKVGIIVKPPFARLIHRDCIGTGTVYFTSIRKEKGVPFTVRESGFYLVFVFLPIPLYVF